MISAIPGQLSKPHGKNKHNCLTNTFSSCCGTQEPFQSEQKLSGFLAGEKMVLPEDFFISPRPGLLDQWPFLSSHKENKTHLNPVCKASVRLSVCANTVSYSSVALNCAFEFSISCVIRTLQTHPQHAILLRSSSNKFKKF